MIGKTWGLNPKNSAWAYTAIARPILTYGLVAWVSCLDRNQVKKLLTKVQRLACVMTTGVIKSTPTTDMEILLGFPPLDVFVESTAIATGIRLQRSGHWGQIDLRYGKDSHNHFE